MAGIEDLQEVASKTQLEQMIADGQPAITSDATLLCQAEGIDVIVEITGTIEYAARVVIDAIDNGKHVVVMNAELDATLGPILNVYAKGKGVIEDYVEAYKWTLLAGMDGHVVADFQKESLKENMTAEQIAEAQKLAKAYAAEMEKK